MEDRELKERVIELLSQLPAYSVNSSGTQHTVRCPYCGDSTNVNHSHFSIKIDVSDPTSPMLYNCLKCPVSGILNASVLEELGIHSDDINSALSRVRSTTRYNKYTNIKSEEYAVPLYDKKAANYAKLDYINDRLGTDFTLEDCKDLKVIMDLSVFSAVNKIPGIKNVSPGLLSLIDSSYVGFLSNNKNCLVYRLINPALKFNRYLKIKINPNNLDPNSYYSIPNKFDIMYTNEINVHISEGIFDILSVFANLNNCNRENNYYYAVCGFGYNTVIDSMIAMGMNTGLNIYIYADRDKTDAEILFKINNPRNRPWINSLYICRNAYPGEKDYGVPKDRIHHTMKRYM